MSLDEPKPRRAAKPTIHERATQPLCPNCGGPVVRRSSRGPLPTFCDARGPGVCKREHNNRALVEGRAVIAFLKGWRIDRGVGDIAKASFAEMVAIADRFNSQDKEAGRPRADLYAAKLLDTGLLYIDREVKSRRDSQRVKEDAATVAN